MRRITLLIITVILVLSANAFSQPKLESSGQKFDFGLTTQNSVIIYSFWLKSTGTDTVTISDIKTGCSCAISTLESDKIAPGDSSYLTISWNTEQATGPIKRYPLIYSNGSAKPLRISLKANVLLSLDSSYSGSIWPFKFEMSRIREMSIDSLEFRIINATDQDFYPVMLSELPAECIIFLPETVPAGGSAFGYAKILPEFVDKEFKTSFTVDFKHGSGNYLTIPIRRKFYGSKSE
ncbi:MAG: DUF1573 domain-containing protein [candidate division Zixibacteria bacterium]|nr:DUF1573 domain-containing protein [candidate division Zixibacteria bacterium]